MAFMLSFITAGEAQKWKEQFMCSIMSNNIPNFQCFYDKTTRWLQGSKPGRLGHAKAGPITTRKLTSGRNGH